MRREELMDQFIHGNGFIGTGRTRDEDGLRKTDFIYLLQAIPKYCCPLVGWQLWSLPLRGSVFRVRTHRGKNLPATRDNQGVT